MYADQGFWTKVLQLLLSLARAVWGPLLAAGLVAGFQYLLKRRDEKRAEKKRLSDQLYMPLRQQLAEAEPAIRTFQRALSVNGEVWQKARATGIADKVGRSIKDQLRELYERTLPDYDAAWKALNEEIDRLRGEWDTKYADIAKYAQAKDYNKVEINWWQFLAGEGPCTPLDGLRDGDVLRIFNGFMTPSRFKLLDLSVEQFLIKRWEEASINPAMRHYRDCRQRALAEVPRVIELLGRESLI